MARLWGLLGLYFAAKKLVLKTMAAKQQRHKKGHGGEEQEGRGAGPQKGLAYSDHDTQDAAAESTFDTLVAHAQLASLIVYQAAENVAFLSSKKVLPASAATQARLGLLSVRAWGLYVAMEAARLLVERRRRVEEAGRKKKKGVGEEDGAWRAQWNKSFYRNLAWAPLTVHWGSASGGFLPDIVVSLLGFYPAWGGMVDLWRETETETETAGA
ncbi:hypothetical protein E4U41_001235 [Claviceps citrina]|nr:hypothetical protein E4U41_001235 [Claviceps citrina]